ncbi:putative methyltransferase-like protein 24 [Pholidichthys leucotaenia]
MWTCVRWWRGRGGLSLRSCVLLLVIPPLLMVLQLLFVGLPGAARVWMGSEEPDGGVAFSIISIEPERHSRQRRIQTRSPGAEEEEEKEETGVYEDENETDSRQVEPKALEVQLWAEGEPSFAAELNRLITYITRPQLNCSKVLSPGQAQAAHPPAVSAHWLLCAEDWLLPAGSCVAYSFSMDGGDADFLKTVSELGCEVHCFDPSNSNASGGHLGNSLASNRGDSGGVVIQHKMWLEWRAPRKHGNKARGNLGGVSQMLAAIMEALGHHTVHFLYADMLSGEWRVFQNWIEAGTLQSIHHLVATVHLQWAGFEVGGTDEEVLRYWFSVLRGLQASGLKLVHSSPGKGHGVLKRAAANARSSYTLSWVNTRH